MESDPIEFAIEFAGNHGASWKQISPLIISSSIPLFLGLFLLREK
jgi:hypothetical protein